MNPSRRKFILAGSGLAVLPFSKLFAKPIPAGQPIVISTWSNVDANKAAWAVLSRDGRALDAVEAGAKIPEANPKEISVGYGGLPDREGKVTLDACIMDEKGNCGSVAFVQNYMHVISIARAVMEKTPHVMLVGAGAEKFAAAQGFKKQNLLTKESEQKYKEWLKTSEYKPDTKVFDNAKTNHDTIGILALDIKGALSGACTTSGMAYKMHGRVGDSPIIGAGLFVDGEVGAATATGVGEEMIRIAGSHTIVELMRNGRSPQEACEEAIKRVIKKNGEARAKELSVAFLALSKDGELGAYSTVNEFFYTITTADQQNVVVQSESYFK
jgi:N4-(beta-N-acetylglucosaminyl)-L-asparaginase